MLPVGEMRRFSCSEIRVRASILGELWLELKYQKLENQIYSKQCGKDVGGVTLNCKSSQQFWQQKNSDSILIFSIVAKIKYKELEKKAQRKILLEIKKEF